MPEKDSTNLPWVEKYRPNALQELISHEDIISTIRTFISQVLSKSVVVFKAAQL